jgi:hypothetical protein
MSTYLAWILGKEHDIIVDNESAAGKNKNTLFSWIKDIGLNKTREKKNFC